MRAASSPRPPPRIFTCTLLPNPRGVDKSYGLGLDLFDGKIVVRVTHYETLQKDIRNGDANTTAQRVIRTDLLLQGATPARFVLQNVAGGTTATFGPNNNQFGWIKAPIRRIPISRSSMSSPGRAACPRLRSTP